MTHAHEPPPTVAEWDALIARAEAGEPSLVPLAFLRGIRPDVVRAEEAANRLSRAIHPPEPEV